MNNLCNSLSRHIIKAIEGKSKKGVWPPECSTLFFQPDRTRMIVESGDMSEKKEK